MLDGCRKKARSCYRAVARLSHDERSVRSIVNRLWALQWPVLFAGFACDLGIEDGEFALFFGGKKKVGEKSPKKEAIANKKASKIY